MDKLIRKKIERNELSKENLAEIVNLTNKASEEVKKEKSATTELEKRRARGKRNYILIKIGKILGIGISLLSILKILRYEIDTELLIAKMKKEAERVQRDFYEAKNAGKDLFKSQEELREKLRKIHEQHMRTLRKNKPLK